MSQFVPLRFAILLALASPAAFPLTAAAQAPADEEPPEEARALDQVVVTGTRASDRTIAESISPIDVIGRDALESTGTLELATALSRLLPSLNFPRPAITDGTDAVRPAQLRGLSPDQVLVLVNGKRRHVTALINVNGSQGRGSSPVDLNAIPISAVERIEVLRDGASAQYGSDAIAGVVNIVLKRSGSGGGIEARHGQYSAGDGAQTQVSGDAGLSFGDAGWMTLAGQVGHADNTNRARPFIATPTPTSPPLGVVVQRLGDPEYDIGALGLNSEFQLTDAIQLYAFGTVSNRDTTSNGFFRAPGDARNIPSIYPNGFLPRIVNYSKDRALVAGVRGVTAGEWSWDLSYNYGYNHLTFEVENSLNRSIGPTSQREFYAGALESTQNILNFDVVKSVEMGWAYPLNVAFGAEHRYEKYNLSPGEPNSYLAGPVPNTPPGAQVFPGFQPSDAGHHDRDSTSVYVDLESDVTERWSVGVAARYEDYSDFGETTSGKLSTRYAFNDTTALRGTVSTGFRAPSLSQQHYQTTATNFIGGVPFEVRTFAVDNPVAVALGAEPLQAEESVNVSLGLVMQPIESLYVTVDAYQIDIDDRIALSENLTGAAVTTFLQGFGIFGVTGGRYFTNAIDTRTRGVDVVATYGWALDSGDTLDLSLGLNYNETDIERIAPNPPELTQGGLQLQRIGRVEQGRIERGAPKDKVVLGALWTHGDWKFDGSVTRYGEFSVLNANPVQDQTFDSEWVLNLSTTYTLDRWSFTLGSDNVTDEYPEELLFANSTSGQIPYSASSPFGFNGAYWYGRVAYRW